MRAAIVCASVLTVLAYASLLALASCGGPGPVGTEAAASGRRDCFSAPLVNRYEVVDIDTVRVRAGALQSYDIDLSGAGCRDIGVTPHAALVGTSSSWICTGTQAGQGDFEFRSPSTGRLTQCHIDAVRRVEAPAA